MATHMYVGQAKQSPPTRPPTHQLAFTAACYLDTVPYASLTWDAMEIGLPYGLSSFHRHARNAGKATAHQLEGCPLQQRPSSNKSTPTTPLPQFTVDHAPPRSFSRSKALKRRLKKFRKVNTGIADSNASQAKVTGATVREKRKRSAEVQPPSTSRLKTTDMRFEQKKLERPQKKSKSYTTCPGASKNRPITIESDSDDAGDTEDNSESDGDVEIISSVSVARESIYSVSPPSRYQSVSLSLCERLGSIYSTPSREIAPPNSVFLTEPESETPRARRQSNTESVVAREDTPLQITRNEHDFKETNNSSSSRKNRKPHRKSKEDPVGTIPISSQRAFPMFSVAATSESRDRTPEIVREKDKSGTVHGSRKDVPENGRMKVHLQEIQAYPWAVDTTTQDLVLAHIADFDLRNKVARLMAVAPDLPVRDLYHLLLEKKGHFEETLKHVVARTSCTPESPKSPALPRKIRSQHLPVVGTTLDSPPTQDLDGDEIMVKIDFDNPDFIYDNAASASPPPETRKKLQTTKKSRYESHSGRTKLPKSAKRTSKSLLVKSPPRSSYRKKGCANICVKRSARSIGTRLQETSSDQEFLVDDEVVFIDPDGSYNEDSGSEGEARKQGSDVEMMDGNYEGTDLTIDMQPKYAYNATLLKKARSGFGKR